MAGAKKKHRRSSGELFRWNYDETAVVGKPVLPLDRHGSAIRNSRYARRKARPVSRDRLGTVRRITRNHPGGRNRRRREKFMTIAVVEAIRRGPRRVFTCAGQGNSRKPAT
jgi:hypothetical protein